MLAERARSRPSAGHERGRGSPKRPDADSYVRVRPFVSSQLSAAQWRRWSVFARSAAVVVSERWAGPNVGPSVTRLPRVSLSLSLSLSPLAHALSLSFRVYLSLLSFVPERLVAVSTSLDRPRFGNETRRTDAPRLRRRDAAVRSEPRRKGGGGRKKKEEEEEGSGSQPQRSITPLDRGAACGRPIVSTDLPTPHRFRNDARRQLRRKEKKNHEGLALGSDRLITHEDLSPSKDPAQRHCGTTLHGSTKKSTSDISNS